MDARPPDFGRRPARLGGIDDRRPRRGHRVPVRHDRRRDRAADRLQSLPEHCPRASPARNRVDLGGAGMAADRRESGSEAPDARARLRATPLPTRRVQDRFEQREVAAGPARHRRPVRGDLPQPHGDARRGRAAFGLVQRDRGGVARGPSRPGGDARTLRRLTGGPRVRESSAVRSATICIATRDVAGICRAAATAVDCRFVALR